MIKFFQKEKLINTIAGINACEFPDTRSVSNPLIDCLIAFIARYMLYNTYAHLTATRVVNFVKNGVFEPIF